MNFKSDPQLPPLNLPAVELKIVSDGKNGVKIYDPLRRKFVAMTPEEYVRQHFVAWLTGDLRYPTHMIANETGITVNGQRKRCDTVIFGRDGNPLMIVEYKAPGVRITQDVFDQIYRYNLTLKAKYLVVSNGFCHYCCLMDYDADTYHFIPQVPDYISLYLNPGDN